MKYIVTSRRAVVEHRRCWMAEKQLADICGGELPNNYDVWVCPDESYISFVSGRIVTPSDAEFQPVRIRLVVDGVKHSVDQYKTVLASIELEAKLRDFFSDTTMSEQDSHTLRAIYSIIRKHRQGDAA